MGPVILKENDLPKVDMANDEDFMDIINLENLDDVVENGHAFRGIEELAIAILNAFRENINGDDIIPNGDAFRGNINRENGDDIIPNGDACRRNINRENGDDIIPNGDAFRGNINRENGDDIIPNDDAFRGNINRENGDDIIPNDDAFRGNINRENGDDIIPNDVFKGFNHFQVYTTPDDNIFAENNENEDNKPSLHMLLFAPTLEHIKNILYNALHQFFDEFEIAVVSCPCLTKPPYGFAAAGLSGNTGILQMGDVGNFISIPQTNLIFDIQSILSSYYYDFFVVGSGFAAKPFMPYNGHLIINAILSANSTNVINNGSIVYENADTGQKISQIINDPNQMKCVLGNFYFSEGKPGMVIKMRVKGRKTLYEFLSLIQSSLYFCCPYEIGLGGIITINGGRTILYITPEKDPEWFIPNMQVTRWLKLHELNCMDLITVGTLINFPSFRRQNSDGSRVIGTRYRFNTFSNSEAVGEFCKDITPDEIEYICYFNIAKEYIFKSDKHFHF
ncbi:ester hydrolase C11orf54 homolog [Cataglyphis hispanica]|uniref:ester hydrolase C11orf54 homolog n=1 Tax=Cataglyphis hispanica TaxID=1086592 RepID=UPI00218041F7|nr:ester hydrolase C11orf54 homolog [Cataglyphis hispanica]